MPRALPGAAAEVQAEVGAHELVWNLRSEISALERHRQVLQTKLERLEESSASKVDCTAAANAWIRAAAASRRPIEPPVVRRSRERGSKATGRGEDSKMTRGMK